MKLKVLVLTRVLIEQPVKKIVAEAEDGWFCLLPRHIDFVTALAPGIMSFENAQSSEEEFIALNGGILVKCGSDVTISTRRAVYSRDLSGLKRTIEEEDRTTGEREKKTRSILFKLETDLARRIFEMRE
jgi:F-type H+-transporting ATPase subunit epsilon